MLGKLSECKVTWYLHVTVTREVNRCSIGFIPVVVVVEVKVNIVEVVVKGYI